MPTKKKIPAQPVTPEPVVEPAAAAPVVEPVAVVEPDAMAQEETRKQGIQAVFKHAPHETELHLECVSDVNCTPMQASDKLLAKMSKGAQPLGGDPVIQTEDSKDRFMAGIVDGALIRAGIKVDEQKNEFRSFGLQDTCRAVLAQNGVDTGRMSTDDIIRAALTHSAGDFPKIYENVMHKTLLEAFRIQADTWSQFCATGDLSDFRAHNRYHTGSFGDLEGLNENGEIVHTTIDDATREQISAAEHGLIFGLTYKMIVDDDMGAFLSVARNLGRAAKRSVENDVYALLALNTNTGPTMGDGTVLFTSGHGNLAGTGGAISVASIGAGRVAMQTQTDNSGNEFLDINPSVLLCPTAKGDGARQVINSETDWASNANSKKINPIRNIVSIVDTPRLSGNGWYLFASPSEAAAIEVGFLRGQSEPEVRTEESFTTRGVKYRITYDYGVAAVEHRGAYRNPGE